MTSKFKKILTNAIDVISKSNHLDLMDIVQKRLSIMQYNNSYVSGEKFFVSNIITKLIDLDRESTIVDVGANEGDYTKLISEALPNCQIYCLEPNPPTADRLSHRFAECKHIHIYRFGAGEHEGELILYDYAGGNGSQHASLYQEVFIEQHRASSICQTTVPLLSLDDFCKKQQIYYIDLLKVDTEGNELSALKGASTMIGASKIGIIHFEFNEMNVISRVFFRDFYQLLKGYNFFRMRKDGLIPLYDYHPRHEIFQYQNIVAISREICPKLPARFVLSTAW